MPDRMDPAARHRCMVANKGRDTRPELLVRGYLWSRGYRYRVNDKRLPGRPDLVLHKYKTCIFINGCFWHGHEGCRYYKVPSSNSDFWIMKVERNRKRDARVREQLLAMGWHCITIWECDLKPQKRDSTLLDLETRLNNILLNEHRIKSYDCQPVMPIPKVAEEELE